MKLLTAKFVDFMSNRVVTSAKRFSGVFSWCFKNYCALHVQEKQNN